MAGNSFYGNMLTGNMEFLQWSCHDVARWIESIGFPQYKVCKRSPDYIEITRTLIAYNIIYIIYNISFFNALTPLFISVAGMFHGELHHRKKANLCKLYLLAKIWNHRF